MENHSNSESVWLQAIKLQILHPDLFAEYSRQSLSESSSAREPPIDSNQEVVP
jgi:hypothetical protein